MKPIAYSYNADVHCVDCARRRFWEYIPATPFDANGVPEGALDNDGNTIHAVLPTDELPTDLTDGEGGSHTMNCGTCRAVISTRNKYLEGVNDNA